MTAEAQFRLQEEQGWDDTISQEDIPDILSIDCQDLAKAVKSIPIHKRLGIGDIARQVNS